MGSTGTSADTAGVAVGDMVAESINIATKVFVEVEATAFVGVTVTKVVLVHLKVAAAIKVQVIEVFSQVAHLAVVLVPHMGTLVDTVVRLRLRTVVDREVLVTVPPVVAQAATAVPRVDLAVIADSYPFT